MGLCRGRVMWLQKLEYISKCGRWDVLSSCCKQETQNLLALLGAPCADTWHMSFQLFWTWGLTGLALARQLVTHQHMILTISLLTGARQKVFWLFVPSCLCPRVPVLPYSSIQPSLYNQVPPMTLAVALAGAFSLLSGHGFSCYPTPLPLWVADNLCLQMSPCYNYCLLNWVIKSTKAVLL